MAGCENEMLTILTSELFNKLGNSNNLKIAEIDAITAILIKLHIPFDLTYSPGTRRIAEALQLRIFINPTTTLSFTISLEAGTNIFSG